jgi:hypothetical protein
MSSEAICGRAGFVFSANSVRLARLLSGGLAAILLEIIFDE